MNAQEIRQKWTLAGLLLVLLLALGLRFYRIDAQSLWNDEGTSVALAQRDLATIARDAAGDIHPPLYYWLLSGWIRLLGTSEAAVRSLSALLGVALVALTCALGWLLGGHWTGLTAACLAAINPFQIYYSQEARMYMLLAVWSALAFYAALMWADREPGGGVHRWGIVYLLASAAGLYTHYAFPMVLAAINLAILLDLALSRAGERWRRRLWHWLALQVGAIVLFAPWLPTAYRQLTTWPNPSEAAGATLSLPSTLTEVWRWLALGPTMGVEWAAVPVVVLALLALLGVLSLALGCLGDASLPCRRSLASLVLWAVLPVVLILALRLYREAYLKFLLVSSPPTILLLACGLLGLPPLISRLMPRVSRLASSISHLVQLAAILVILIPSASALRNYYSDPAFARDDYRGIAAYIEAVERPGDAVLLNAPGQQEVFGYYYGGDLPVYALPRTRPLEPAATQATLEELAQPGGRVFAVFWATAESDPERFVEGWLDSHAYKALDSWYGNVRLAIYAIPEEAPAAPHQALNVSLGGAGTGDAITLLGYTLLNERLAAGDIAQVTLFWRADRVPSQRYKVFLHVLDAGNHIVGQRDAEPGGGVRLTTLWTPGETVADNHGVSIHPATPPGEYRVEVGLYALETGQRLVTSGGETQVWLAPLDVDRPVAPPPVAALGMQHAEGASFGELALLGYDAYPLGQGESAPLLPGDVLHANLYWRAAARPTGDWQVEIALVDDGEQVQVSIATEPVGGYPTSRWQKGDVWRGQFDLVVPASMPQGRYRLRVSPVTDGGARLDPFLSRPLLVGP